MYRVKTVEQKMEEFVSIYGAIPAAARKLHDYEARQHNDIWIQRLLGDGITCNHVIGYQLGGEWWTFCFDRKDDAWEEASEEIWIVEAYDSCGGSSRQAFLYDVLGRRWRRARDGEALHPFTISRSTGAYRRN